MAIPGSKASILLDMLSVHDMTNFPSFSMACYHHLEQSYVMKHIPNDTLCTLHVLCLISAYNSGTGTATGTGNGYRDQVQGTGTETRYRDQVQGPGTGTRYSTVKYSTVQYQCSQVWYSLKNCKTMT